LKLQTKLAVLAGALALVAIPALAGAAVPNDPGTSLRPTTTTGQPTTTVPNNPGTSLKPTNPGPKASLPTLAKAYGFRCQGADKKHSEQQKTGKTPFAICVTDMAKLAVGSVDTPKQACSNLTKKHVKGQKRSPYAVCVSGGQDLLQDLQDQSQQGTS
jgi:hypothetical protein